MSRPALRTRLLALIVGLGLSSTLLAPPAGAVALNVPAIDPLVVTVSPNIVRIQNGLVSRIWANTPIGFRTSFFTDLRTGRQWLPSDGSNEFTLRRGPLSWNSSDFLLASTDQTPIAAGGTRVTMHLTPRKLPLEIPFGVDRVIEAWPNVAGFRTRTVVRALIPLTIDTYSIDEVTVAPGLAGSLVPRGQTFHAGSDWRDEEGWKPQLQIGGKDTPRNGRADWRVQTNGPAGGPYEVNGEHLSVRAPDGSSLFIAVERPDLPSTRVSYANGRAAADAVLAHDIIDLGPIESDVHIEGKGNVPVRARPILPGQTIELEPAFVGLSTSADDEAWQLTKYLAAAGWDYPLAVTFNTNPIDAGRLGNGGAKDDVDQAEFFKQLPIAQRLGIETFVFDDGWQLNSGDWVPDPSRFPGGFAPIDAALRARGMRLGLWMSPMAFHPNSKAFRKHPEWSCLPTGTATAAENLFEDATDQGLFGGSAEAGVGLWNPDAIAPDGTQIADLEAKIAREITDYGSVYFKFDFLVWLDCVNPSPTDAYRYRESFRDMVDRLHARFPEVTFQIDETNDYRMWPYESVVRGPSWFQNGSPNPDMLLHNLWTVSPYVPTYSIGQAALGHANQFSVDYLMSMAMLSHMTFWTDMTTYTPAQVTAARVWVDRYKTIRGELSGDVVYPLLGDPAGGQQWAALQPWNPDTQQGFLFAFRQNTAQTNTYIPLRGLEPGASYHVTDLVTGADVGTFTGAHLAAGLYVYAGTRYSARILRIVRL